MGKNGHLPMPVVDFTRVGRKWTKEFSALIHKAERANRVLMSLQPEGSSLEAIEEYEGLYDKYLNTLNTIGQEQIGVITEIVVSVPQACLTEGAPPTEDIDWGNPENYDYLRQDVITEFFTGLQTGELARRSAKN